MRNKNSTAPWIVIILALISMQGFACAPRTSPDNGVTVKGYVTMIGNEPFTQLAIVTAENVTYELVGAKAEELAALQGSLVEVQGRAAGKGLYAEEKIEVITYRKL